MTREVHEIPPAPRLVRWRAVLWRRWPLLLLGLLGGVYGGLFAIMLGYASTGGLSRSDTLLDEAGANVPRAKARVVKVEPAAAHAHGELLEYVHFVFEGGSGLVPGICLAPRGRYAVDAVAVAEYDPLRERDGISRLEGTRVATVPVAGALGLWLRAVVLPGALALVAWWLGVVRVRRMLQNGIVAVAEVRSLRKLRWVAPEMLRVEFAFRDQHAHVRHGRHWVRAHSALGQRLARNSARLTVVHDRARPRRCRLVLPEDFRARAPSSGTPSSGTPSSGAPQPNA
jgi:hypothetical protein